ncbi:hypothetical protein KY346_04135 [Candidatus Woesearchaeota archaeon]|nr:hypothetical protein [Candidatus Woesearchaeota archaeon]
MVTAKDYLKAFASSMKNRNKVFWSLIKQKNKLDKRVIKGKANEAEIVQLMFLIGDGKLRPRQSLEDQCIRWFLYKTARTADIFEKNKAELMKKAAAEQAAQPKTQALVNDIITTVNSLSNPLQDIKKYVANFEEIYARQLTALNAKQFDAYAALVDEERKQITAYSAYLNAVAKTANERFNRITAKIASVDENTIRAIPFALILLATGACAVTGVTIAVGPVAVIGGILAVAGVAMVAAIPTAILSRMMKDMES